MFDKNRNKKENGLPRSILVPIVHKKKLCKKQRKEIQ